MIRDSIRNKENREWKMKDKKEKERRRINHENIFYLINCGSLVSSTLNQLISLGSGGEPEIFSLVNRLRLKKLNINK